MRSDHKWVSQYDGAFIIFNREGKIVSWQYTKSSGFDQVHVLLQAVAKRGTSQGTEVKTIYVDNCCQWRNKLQEIFGERCQVKLDVFHAVQRVVQRIPKRHPFHAPCARDMGIVFREAQDQGPARTKATPSPTILLANLDSFIKRWENVSFDGNPVLTVNALSELDKLKVHIRKGCLSGIPVGCGTNRNEVFHRYIRAFFHRSRVGMLVAYALMMAIIYQFNTADESRKQVSPPITTFSNLLTTTPIEPMGVIRSPTTTIADYTWQQDNSENDIIDESSAIALLNQSLSQHQLVSQMGKHSDTATNIWKFIQFSQVIPAITSRLGDKAHHMRRLNHLVHSWNFSIINVPEDGNCFFTSVALELSNFAKASIEQLGLPLSAPITELVTKLRNVMVDELLGPRRHLYEEFFPNVDTLQYVEHANNFRMNYFYNCELGNAMPAALANALSMSFVIFTSHDRSPVYYVTSASATSANVLYMAYNAHGNGHYQACIPASDTPIQTKPIVCRCGVNRRESDKENYVACNHSRSSRHSTCKCLAAKKACSHHCKCKGCSNPYGLRSVLGKRKREAHDWQKVNTSGADFAIDRDNLVQGKWSRFKNIVFVNVVGHLEEEMLDASTACEAYNYVVSFAESSCCTISVPGDLQLRHKSEKQCEGKIREYKQEKVLFSQVMQQ